MNPLLMELLKRSTEPMVGETGVERSLTEPKLDQSPGMARLKGFGAGAIEGARSFTSPMSLALTALPGGRAAKTAVRAARGLAGVTPELVQGARAVKQVMPEADDVTRLAAQLKQRMMQVPTSSKIPGGVKTLGQTSAEFTPKGGEAAYNAARRMGMSPVPTPTSFAHEGLLKKLGGQAGEVNPNLILGGGAALGGGLLAKKLYDAIRGVGDKIQETNPLNKASDILEEAAGGRGNY